MTNTRIDMLDIRQLIRLKQAGFSNREIARRTGIHRTTVNSYLFILTAQVDLSSGCMKIFLQEHEVD